MNGVGGGGRARKGRGPDTRLKTLSITFHFLFWRLPSSILSPCFSATLPFLEYIHSFLESLIRDDIKREKAWENSLSCRLDLEITTSCRRPGHATFT